MPQNTHTHTRRGSYQAMKSECTGRYSGCKCKGQREKCTLKSGKNKTETQTFVGICHCEAKVFWLSIRSEVIRMMAPHVLPLSPPSSTSGLVAALKRDQFIAVWIWLHFSPPYTLDAFRSSAFGFVPCGSATQSVGKVRLVANGSISGKIIPFAEKVNTSPKH